MEKIYFPNRLKFFRRCSGHSQKKIARMLGLADTSALSRWEHGVAQPGLMQIFHLARIYRVLPHELFEDLWNHLGSKYDLLAQDTEPFITNQSFYL